MKWKWAEPIPKYEFKGRHRGQFDRPTLAWDSKTGMVLNSGWLSFAGIQVVWTKQLQYSSREYFAGGKVNKF